MCCKCNGKEPERSLVDVWNCRMLSFPTFLKLKKKKKISVSLPFSPLSTPMESSPMMVLFYFLNCFRI